VKAERINYGGLLLYIASGISAVLLASWLSSQLIGKAFSQQPSQPAYQGAVPPNNNAALPAPNAVSVPSTGTQILTVISDSKKDRPAPEVEGESKIPDLLIGIIEDYNYTASGKRDPFTPFERASSTAPMGPIWPLQKYDLEQLKLVGVIWEVKVPKAMILDPSGHGYVVTINERVGRNNGYIARIREGEIVVVENILGVDGKSSYVTKIMKLHPQ
jgi:type IV pilus assembly protein PilP